jgi:hypothetical protein
MDTCKEPDEQGDTPATSNENSQESEISSKSNNEENDCPEISKNLEIDDLSENDRENLRGDAIGDTLYSERFVLKTLMELKELDVEKKLESAMVSLLISQMSLADKALNVIKNCN